jgi:hypothetical protein
MDFGAIGSTPASTRRDHHTARIWSPPCLPSEGAPYERALAKVRPTSGSASAGVQWQSHLSPAQAQLPPSYLQTMGSVHVESFAGFADGHAPASVIPKVVQLQVRPASDAGLTRHTQLSFA